MKNANVYLYGYRIAMAFVVAAFMGAWAFMIYAVIHFILKYW